MEDNQQYQFSELMFLLIFFGFILGLVIMLYKGRKN